MSTIDSRPYRVIKNASYLIGLLGAASSLIPAVEIVSILCFPFALIGATMSIIKMIVVVRKKFSGPRPHAPHHEESRQLRLGQVEKVVAST